MKTYESIFKVENNKKSDVIRTFQNFLPGRNIGRNNSANIITGRQGLQPKAQNTPSPHTAFELYFTADILQSVVLHTNTKLPDNFVARDSRYSYMKEVTVENIYAFIGLYRGLYKLHLICR